MVRTRLSGGNEDSTDSFLPQSRDSETKVTRSESEEIVSTIQDGHLYDTSRRKQNRIFDLGSNHSASHTGSAVYSTRRRSRQQSFSDHSPRNRHFGSGPEVTMSRRRTRQRIVSSPDEDSNDEEEERNTRRRGPPKRSPSPELRRSTRKRKPLYATMDQSALVGGYEYSADMYEWGTRSRSRTVIPREEENKVEQPEEGEEEDQVNRGGSGHDEEEEDEDYRGEDENNNQEDEEDEDEMDRLDMYSRVKQRHIQARKMREAKRREEEERRRQAEERDSEEEMTEEEETEEETSDDDEDEDEEIGQRNYHLRQHRPLTKRFEVPVEVPMRRRRKSEIEEVFGAASSPIRRRYPKTRNHLTPIRSPRFARRMHHATHHSSSTSSEGSGDEQRFERRKAKSMAKARMRCLPMNLNADDVSTGTLRDRQKVGSSLADVDPMNVDTSITFDSVGGLNKHIQSLKEMIVFPLLYPEVFDKFKINPPRGVLFHGPPGTGKTLVARALANECRSGDKKVAFFMRKGADCLSKWVGESERQLRLLFDQAYTMRPSIIFFDEIDGLAPVRSSRQDQIHSSIVSTLLALMDGLDSRGEIVVIGATNRIDSIDPALRRPGRFDREFPFQLPSCEARKSILSIHTKDWSPKLANSFLAEVAERCVGYCGADLKALCTETALNALRHQFPQVYASKEKLQLDLSQIEVSARDFHLAMQNIVPAAQRAVVSPGRALSAVARPLLQSQLDYTIDGLKRYFPVAFSAKKSGKPDNGPGSSQDVFWDLLNGDVYDDEEGPSIFETPNPWKRRRTDEVQPSTFLNFAGSSFSGPSAFRPRLLLVGGMDQGHSTHIAPAVLHCVEGIPVHCLDLPALYAVSAKTPEENCAQVFREARRSSPCVIYMPHIVQWWSATGYTVQATFLTLLHDLPPSAPILLLATADCPVLDIPAEIQSLFHSHHERYTMRNPTTDERRAFFTELIITEAAKPPPKRKNIAAKALEALPVATPTEPRTLTEQELSKLQESEEATLRELRIFLREVLARLAHERKFRTFTKAVDPEEVPDYFVVIRKPMDLSTMLNKINMHQYMCGRDFLVDIDLITSNALEYNPDIDPSDRQIRNYACELKDMAHSIVDAEMDPDFERMCREIAKSRQERGDAAKSKDAPSYYRTLPQLKQEQAQENAKNNPTPPVMKRRTYPRVPMSPFRAIKRRRSSAWARGFIPKRKYPQKKKDDESKDSGENERTEAVSHKKFEVLGIQRRVIKRKRRSTWSRGFIRKPKKKVKKEDEEGAREERGSSEEQDELRDSQEARDNRPDERTEEGGKEEHEAENEVEQQQTGSSNEEVQPKVDDEQDNGHKSGEDTDEYFDDENPGKVHDDDHPASASTVKEAQRPAARESEAQGGNTTAAMLTNGLENSDDDSIKSAPAGVKDLSENGKKLSEDREDPSEDGKGEEVIEVNGDIENSDGGKRETNGVEGEENSTSKTQEIEANVDESVQLTKRAEIPLRRVTRRMLAEVHATRALQILEEPEPDLVVDKAKLQTLLESVVEMTSNWTVSRLEKVHCRLSQCIYRHRMEYDKGSLTKEMEEIVQSLLIDQ